MKQWFSKDSTKLRLGAAGLTLFTVVALAASLQGQGQNRLQQASRTRLDSAPTQQAALVEKPKLAAQTTQVVVSEEEVPFTTTQTFDGTLAKDTKLVRVEGRVGKKIIRTEVRTRDGVEVGRQLISEEITVPPVAEVVAVGTKHVPQRSADGTADHCDPRYRPCVKLSARDVDCREVGHRVRVVVIGEDPHGFDRDENGIGCEMYPDRAADTAGNSRAED